LNVFFDLGERDLRGLDHKLRAEPQILRRKLPHELPVVAVELDDVDKGHKQDSLRLQVDGLRNRPAFHPKLQPCQQLD